jgi:hypothetical protein
VTCSILPGTPHAQILAPAARLQKRRQRVSGLLPGRPCRLSPLLFVDRYEAHSGVLADRSPQQE